MYAAKNHRIARYSLPFTVLLVIIFLSYGNLYLGAAARVLVWDGVRSPDQAFPLLITTYLSPVVAAFVLTGIASAAMSTTDSLLLMSGSAVAHDVLRKCIHEPRGIERDERYYLRVSRVSIVAIGAIAFVCAIPDVALLLRIVSFAVAILGACFFFPLVVGMNCRAVSREAALASSVSGVIVTVVWIAATLNGSEWALEVHPGAPGLITAGLVMLGVSCVTRPVDAASLGRFFPERSR
jgi:Na+/proline symporter